MQGNTHVEWTGAEGALVRIDIYKNGEYFAEYLDWTENSGYAEPPYPLDRTLLPGAYYIEIIDDLGRWGIGGDFTIE